MSKTHASTPARSPYPVPPESGSAPAAAPTQFTIREVAQRTGVTEHTLRYYERIGLLAGVPRAASGHRRYGEDEVRWVVFLRKIHQTGMPIRRMLEYAQLLRRGDSTIRDRRLLLEDHRKEVEARMIELRANLELIDFKISLYKEREAQGPPSGQYELIRDHAPAVDRPAKRSSLRR
ncbi:MAG TPA: MerR family transcriptional regulator [Polyangiaceae bacterium]|nr:MerR family transcriptional regulator [Polyangiaceae bacterium]